MQIILHCEPDALIVMHDFASRPHYHAVHAVAREIARAQDLLVFSPIGPATHRRARTILSDHAVLHD